MTDRHGGGVAGRLGRRGVSDLVGFAVVFGIVVLSISLLYTVGTGTLGELQHGHAVDNTERAFDILATNVEDLSRNGAPGRATEIQLASGELALTGSTTISISNASTFPGEPVSVISPATAVTYTRRDSGVHYDAGSVIRTHREQAVMVDEPRFDFESGRTVLSLIELVPAGESRSIGGAGSVLVSTRSGGSTVERIVRVPDTDYELSVRSPRFRAWERYFDRQPNGSTTVDAANETVTYEFTTDALYVRRTAVRVRLTS